MLPSALRLRARGRPGAHARRRVAPQMRAPVPRTALSHAAQNGHTEVARLLLDKGADKDVADVVRSSRGLVAAALHSGAKLAWSQPCPHAAREARR